MMRSKLWMVGVLFMGMAAGVGPLSASAGGDPLASPTPKSTQPSPELSRGRITAPVISGSNPEVILSEGEQGDITPSGSVSDSPQIPAVLPPAFVELKHPALPVGFQPQEPGTVDCGPASLAMALASQSPSTEGSAPSLSELKSWLENRGLMYEWGTGVEELAYAARNFGFKGSNPFHGWGIDQLQEEIRAGNPPLVTLGTNGPGLPGHFVVLTGISPDGSQVTFQDPQRGKVQLPREEFLALWESQGRSGLVLRQEGLTGKADNLAPWLGLLGAVSALALSLGTKTGSADQKWLSGWHKILSDPRRKGIGGGQLEQVQSAGGTVFKNIQEKNPNQTASKKVPPGKPRLVKVGMRGIEEQVPIYRTKQVFAGLRKDIQRHPVYQRKRVLTGARWVEKRIPVTRYRNQKIRVWKKITQRIPVTRRIGRKKFVVGYRSRVSWKRVWKYKKVPCRTTKRILVKEPVYSWKKVQTGWRKVTRWVPKYKQKQVLVGYKTVHRTMPIFEKQPARVGVKRMPPDQQGREFTGSDQGRGSGHPGRESLSRDLRLLDKLILDPTISSVPTGFSKAVWESLRDEDRGRIRQKGMDWIKKQAELENLQENRVYRAYQKLERIREGAARFGKSLGLDSPSGELPHLVSLSADKELPVDLLDQGGGVISTYQPPNLLGLLYMQQKLKISDKMVFTAYPEGVLDLNLSSGAHTVRLGNIKLHGSLDGSFGLSFRKKNSNPQYEETWEKYLISLTSDGAKIKYQLDGIIFKDDLINGKITLKNVINLSAKTTIIRKEAVAALVGTGVLLYLLGTSGALATPPLWEELLGLAN